MKTLMQAFLEKEFPGLPQTVHAELTDKTVDFICTPEFASHYPERIPSLPDLGLGKHVNTKWSIAMSALTEAAKAAIANLKDTLDKKTSPTDDQIVTAVHTVVDPQIAAITSQVQAITASEADDASKISDLTDVISTFTDAFAPAAAPVTPLPTEASSGDGSASNGQTAGAATA